MLLYQIETTLLRVPSYWSNFLVPGSIPGPLSQHRAFKAALLLLGHLSLGLKWLWDCQVDPSTTTNFFQYSVLKSIGWPNFFSWSKVASLKVGGCVIRRVPQHALHADLGQSDEPHRVTFLAGLGFGSFQKWFRHLEDQRLSTGQEKSLVSALLGYGPSLPLKETKKLSPG